MRQHVRHMRVSALQPGGCWSLANHVEELGESRERTSVADVGETWLANSKHSIKCFCVRAVRHVSGPRTLALSWLGNWGVRSLTLDVGLILDPACHVQDLGCCPLDPDAAEFVLAEAGHQCSNFIQSSYQILAAAQLPKNSKLRPTGFCKMCTSYRQSEMHGYYLRPFHLQEVDDRLYKCPQSLETSI